MKLDFDTPIIDKLKEKGEKLTVPVIIMRCGGLDGVSLQAKEYSSMLSNCIDVNVHIITGRNEQEYKCVEAAYSEPSIIPVFVFFYSFS